MKPDWKDAPQEADYVAMDASGEWYLYVGKPKLGNHCWIGKDCYQVNTIEGWKDSLEKRP